MTRIAVIGAGWAGAVAARLLHDAGLEVVVFEKARVVGGHSRAEILDGVVYEPNGAHIFHTSDERVRDFVTAHGLTRPYEHRVLTEAYLHDDDDDPVLLSWPPQIEELRTLPIWDTVQKELADLPAQAHGDDFEEHVISLMGPTLYRIFVRDYTIKQWGCDPRELSSVFAPKRVELRDDGYRRLFRDRWEFFAAEGVNSVIESVLAPLSVSVATEVSLADVEDLARKFDRIVLTAALDDFVGRPGTLAWRGIEMRSRYIPTDSPTDTVTAAYVVNRPSARVPYTRTVETKHASGQAIGGTVVSEEFPGAPARHYPVHTVEGENEATNLALQAEIRDACPVPVAFTGRLATYRYIDQDQAIADAMATADGILAELAGGTV